MAECPEGASGTVTVTEETSESPSVCYTLFVMLHLKRLVLTDTAGFVVRSEPLPN